jgi:hypothetical protein
MKYIRLVSIFLAAWMSAGCWDFVAPDFPEAGAPAVLQLNVSVDEAGTVGVNGVLAPGLDIGGVIRDVADDTIEVFGVRIGPSAVRRNGTREYNFTQRVPSVTLSTPLDIRAPDVNNVPGPPPQIHWFGIRKTDPDTLRWTRGTDLVLHLENDLGTSVPQPGLRQWFLQLNGNVAFRISSDGFPPEELRIPPQFVPASVSKVVLVTLSFFQSAQIFSNTYIGNFGHNVLIRWIIKVEE